MDKSIRLAVLEELQWRGPRSASELAKQLRLPAPAVRAAVAKLYDEDLVERLHETNAIQLTNKG